MVAPLHMVKCTLGVPLRNAIENYHCGDIIIKLREDSTVIIENKSNELSMQQISELYGGLQEKPVEAAVG